MKRFIVMDDYSNYKTIADEKELKALLVEDIKTDTLENIDDRDIVKNNFEIMEKLALNTYTIDFLTKELESCGWYVQDLWQLQEDLSNFQTYKHGVGIPIIPNDCIEQTLKMIESEMNK